MKTLAVKAFPEKRLKALDSNSFLEKIYFQVLHPKSLQKEVPDGRECRKCLKSIPIA